MCFFFVFSPKMNPWLIYLHHILANIVCMHFYTSEWCEHLCSSEKGSVHYDRDPFVIESRLICICLFLFSILIFIGMESSFTHLHDWFSLLWCMWHWVHVVWITIEWLSFVSRVWWCICLINHVSLWYPYVCFPIPLSHAGEFSSLVSHEIRFFLWTPACYICI